MKKLLVLMLLMLVVGLPINAQKTSPNEKTFEEIPTLYPVEEKDIPLDGVPSFGVDSVPKRKADLYGNGIERHFRFGSLFDTDYEMAHRFSATSDLSFPKTHFEKTWFHNSAMAGGLPGFPADWRGIYGKLPDFIDKSEMFDTHSPYWLETDSYLQYQYKIITITVNP